MEFKYLLSTFPLQIENSTFCVWFFWSSNENTYEMKRNKAKANFQILNQTKTDEQKEKKE